jgi:hypothetical protein
MNRITMNLKKYQPEQKNKWDAAHLIQQVCDVHVRIQN